MNELQIGAFKNILEKLAAEIVFAEVGKDTGLLAVNSLLRQIEELFTEAPAPPAIDSAIRYGRRWLDELFDATTISFTELALQRFHQWAEWMRCALSAFEEKVILPTVPSQWDTSDPGPIEAPLSPAPAVGQGLSVAGSEPVVTLNAESDADLLREFINESDEHLQNIEQGVLVLEENPTDVDTLNTIFRAFHTFKGGSGFLNLTAIQALAHELESLLDQVRQNKLAVTPAVIDLILEGADTLKRFVAEIDAQISGKVPAGSILVPTCQLLAHIHAVLAGDLPPPSQDPISPLPPTPANPVGPAPVVPARVEVGERERHLKNAPSGSSVKVDTIKLDSLVDLVGELVIGQLLVAQNRALGEIQDQQLTRDLAQLGRITKDLQRTAMSLRMVPIRATFQKMNRLVRDTSARLGKQAELVMEGEETELDRTIIEQISDPLIHMIRNAIDHGIELPGVRAQRGKPPQGTIWLKAYYQGGNIVIEIKDDGNGLDKDKLLAKAVEKGIVAAGTPLAEREVFGLIFAAGFSTAEKISDLSGRGVGMDVVRRNIEKLRGKVEIQSTLGQGSTFSISVPLTLAIIDGLIVGVGEHRYIIPTFSVCESFRPAPGMITSLHGRGEMISVRGQLRPVLRLYEHLGIEPTSTDPRQLIAVVVEAGKNARCVLVDQLLGKQEVVIKSLGETFKHNRSLAGAAILGDGRVGLILDPHALVALESDVVSQAA